MLKAKFISNCLYDNLDEVKIAALYYDEIEVLNNIVYTLERTQNSPDIFKIRGAYNCMEDNFRDSLRIFESEGIVKYTEIEDCSIVPAEAPCKSRASDLLNEMTKQASKLIDNTREKLWTEEVKSNGRLVKLNDEVISVHNSYLNKMEVGATIDFEFIFNYYKNLLSHLLFSLYSSKNTITSSNILNDFITNHYITALMKDAPQDYKNYEISQPNLAMEAIRLYLPNVSNMSMEDILEIRVKLKDELQKFRYCIGELNKKLSSTYDKSEIISNAQEYMSLMIVPAVNELEGKIKGVKLGIASQLITELKDPKTYTPFLGSLLLNIPSHLTFLLSLGLVSAKAAIDYTKELTHLRNNGLYFLIKLKQK